MADWLIVLYLRPVWPPENCLSIYSLTIFILLGKHSPAKSAENSWRINIVWRYDQLPFIYKVNISVCLSICPLFCMSDHNLGTPRPIFSKFWYGELNRTMEIFLVGFRNSYLEYVKFPIFNIFILYFYFLSPSFTTFTYFKQVWTG